MAMFLNFYAYIFVCVCVSDSVPPSVHFDSFDFYTVQVEKRARKTKKKIFSFENIPCCFIFYFSTQTLCTYSFSLLDQNERWKAKRQHGKEEKKNFTCVFVYLWHQNGVEKTFWINIYPFGVWLCLFNKSWRSNKSRISNVNLSRVLLSECRSICRLWVSSGKGEFNANPKSLFIGSINFFSLFNFI